MKLSYRQKLFLYFGLLFAFFTAGIIVFEQVRERNYKTQGLEDKLEAYTDIIQNGLSTSQTQLIPTLNQLQRILPENLRITIISHNGYVLFDNSIDDYTHLSNHIDRPEIVKTQQTGKGADIRQSDSNQQKYLYFAKKSDDKFIRVALPYSIQLQQFLKPDNASLYFIILFFGIFLFFIHITTKKLGKTIRQLRDYVLNSDKFDRAQLKFPNDEVGEIGYKIADNYHQLKESKKNILLEKQKLLQHIQVLEEGICFLSSNLKVEYNNGLFIQYLNTITDEAYNDASYILNDENFKKLHAFLTQNQQHYFETTITKQGKVFLVRANIFEDNSFEIMLSDISKREKTKQLKQEMTGNIAHELRTPITSIRGYLETVLNTTLDEQKKHYFIERAFQQTLSLSEIIQDMSIIAKMEEAPNAFPLEQVDIKALLLRIKSEAQIRLDSKNFDMHWHLPETITLQGNPNLLYALFNNLIENAIRYAGENIKIRINLYNEDDDYYYFTFYDTGVGIQDESHLNRIFERFYRINAGRTRDSGGSGLGLSIVKNAVGFHKGKIMAKNRKEGGLEFLFTLKK